MTDPRDPDETLAAPEASRPSASGVPGERFAPGTVLGDRYRIVGLLGRGGMGEVYRADDLKLGESVALKFLSPELRGDGAVLARLHAEVRTARQITHRNVVRAHDLGEVDGEAFLAMEYVDGEDLDSLLRRIGRLPEPKAIELSRQICAGLAAAHERGVLHRDLKPANVMIDGEGRAKITDFGLADLAAELEQPEVAGTPRYMAPEQLAEGRASFASDVYSLGLVLYEMFTGAKPFAASNRAELLTAQRDESASSLASHVEGIDPTVERAILACLAHDPELRPRSPLDVSARLPGGDPLAAALAAGETPSPEMVARARVQGALKPALARACLAALVGLLVVGAWTGERVDAAKLLELPRAPILLEDRARTLLGAYGYEGESAIGSWSGLRPDRETFEHWRTLEPASAVRQLISNRPAPLRYWYVALGEPRKGPLRAARWTDFEDLRAGDRQVELSPDGALLRLAVRPRGAETESPAVEREIDWSSLFDEADLDLDAFAPAPATELPAMFADRRLAWTGSHPEMPGLELRVEAAALAGRPVWFELRMPWHKLSAAGSRTLFGPLALVMSVVVPTALLVGGTLAVRNLRSGRGDRRGALRLAIAIGVLGFGSWILDAPVFGLVDNPVVQGISAIGGTLFWAGFFWLLYLAVEPALRSRWPEGLVSWTRLVSGRWRDPLVGRDLLLGGLMGAAAAVVWRLVRLLEGPAMWDGFWSEALAGPAGALFQIFLLHPYVALLNTFTAVLAFTLFLSLVRRRGIATALQAILFGLQFGLLLGPSVPVEFVAVAIMSTLYAVSTGYVGVLATCSWGYFFLALQASPLLTLDLSSWYAPWTGLAWLLALGLSVFAYLQATRGEPLSAPR